MNKTIPSVKDQLKTKIGDFLIAISILTIIKFMFNPVMPNQQTLWILGIWMFISLATAFSKGIEYKVKKLTMAKILVGIIYSTIIIGMLIAKNWLLIMALAGVTAFCLEALECHIIKFFIEKEQVVK